MRILWLIGGLLSLVLGIFGSFLPLLPTVPLILLAAFCFARSSDKLHDWLVNHRYFGSHILAWRESGSIGRRPKILASLTILLSVAGSFWLGFSSFVILVQAGTLAFVLVFIWSRPEA